LLSGVVVTGLMFSRPKVSSGTCEERPHPHVLFDVAAGDRIHAGRPAPRDPLPGVNEVAWSQTKLNRSPDCLHGSARARRCSLRW
jgi:hypothetical protein